MSHYDYDPPALYCTRCGGPAVAEDLCSAHLDDYHAFLAADAARFSAAVDAAVAEARATFAGYSYDELAESHWMGHESYGETLAQFRSEVALYGDGWPGGALDLACMNARLGVLGELLATHPDRPAPTVPEAPVMSATSEEEPF